MSGRYAYVVGDTCTDRCFWVFDVSSPGSPSEVGWYDTGLAQDVAVRNGYAYVVGNNGLSVLDVSNPRSPGPAGSYGSVTFYAVALGGRYAYVTGWSGLCIVDVSHPGSNPVEVAAWSSDVPAMGVATDGSLVYVTAGGLHIVRPDLSNPYEEGAYEPNAGEDYQKVAVEGFYAYVADRKGGLRVIKVSNSGNPQEVGYYDPAGGAGRGVTVEDGYVYLANEEYGLYILQFAPSVEATIPTSGGTFTSTLDRTMYVFPSGAFSAPVVVTHTMRLAGVPDFGDLVGVNHVFEVQAVYSETGQPAQVVPGEGYTVTVVYGDVEKGVAVEDTLALYYWDGSRWVKEESSRVEAAGNALVAVPGHMSLWAVLGETRRVYLPPVLKGY